MSVNIFSIKNRINPNQGQWETVGQGMWLLGSQKYQGEGRDPVIILLNIDSLFLILVCLRVFQLAKSVVNELNFTPKN